MFSSKSKYKNALLKHDLNVSLVTGESSDSSKPMPSYDRQSVTFGRAPPMERGLIELHRNSCSENRLFEYHFSEAS